jgi:hypothetical protein
LSPERVTEPAATLPVSSTDRSDDGPFLSSCEGVLASVAALKLV